MKCLLNYLGDIGCILHHEAMLHDRAGNAHHISFLKTITANQPALNLTGNYNYRNGIHISGSDASHGIGSTGTRSHQNHTGLARGARVAVGRMGSRLLMAH